MPVPEARQLRLLGERLKRATREGEWDELRRIDAELSELARALGGTLPAPLASAWAPLMEAHAEARRACDQALLAVGERMTELPTQRAAGQAYAAQDGEAVA